MTNYNFFISVIHSSPNAMEVYLLIATPVADDFVSPGVLHLLVSSVGLQAPLE